MKSRKLSSAIVVIALVIAVPASLFAQNPPPARSANAAAVSDVQFISENITDSRDVMALSQTALDRASDTRVRELAEQTLADETQMLYMLEQLQAAGGKSGQQESGSNDRQALAVKRSLSGVSGTAFDSTWVSGLLSIQQKKYEQLAQAKETVTNPQLKMAVTESIPLVRKQVSQLKSIEKYLAKMAAQRRKEAEREKAAAKREK